MVLFSKKIAVLALCTMAAATILAQGRKMPPVKLPCAKVVQVDKVVSRLYTGMISSYDDADIVTRVSGYIRKTYFTQGEPVKAGQLLYLVEDDVYKAVMDANAAKVAQIEAELAYTKKQMERNSRLRKNNAVSDSTLEDANRAYKQSLAKLAEAKAVLANSKIDYKYTRIYSPISGYAGKSAYSENSYITPAVGTMLTVICFDPIYVVFSMSERDYYNMFSDRDDLKKNGILEVQMPNGAIYPEKGWIRIVDNHVDSDTGTLKIWGMIKNPKNILIAGSLINVRLYRKNTDKVCAVLPSSMLTDSRSTYLFVVENGKAVRRDVKIGEIVDGLQTILSGLKPGEIVITDGTHKVRPGGDVIPVFAEQEKGSKK